MGWWVCCTILPPGWLENVGRGTQRKRGVGVRPVTHQIYTYIKKGVTEAYILRLCTDLVRYYKIINTSITLVTWVRMVSFSSLMN